MFPSPHIFEPTTSHFPFKIIPQFFPSLDAFNKSLTNLCVSHKRSTKVYYINQRIWISHIRQIFSKNRDGRPSEYLKEGSGPLCRKVEVQCSESSKAFPLCSWLWIKSLNYEGQNFWKMNCSLQIHQFISQAEMAAWM